MKYLIVIVVVAVAAWMLLRGRKPDRTARPDRMRQEAHQTMVECSHCGIHLPRTEALSSDRGFFCSQGHRLAGPRDE